MELNSLYNAIANTPNTAGGTESKYKPVALFEYSDRTSAILHIAVIQCIQ